jgi:hypothetical protein
MRPEMPTLQDLTRAKRGSAAQYSVSVLQKQGWKFPLTRLTVGDDQALLEFYVLLSNREVCVSLLFLRGAAGCGMGVSFTLTLILTLTLTLTLTLALTLTSPTHFLPPVSSHVV